MSRKKILLTGIMTTLLFMLTTSFVLAHQSSGQAMSQMSSNADMENMLAMPGMTEMPHSSLDHTKRSIVSGAWSNPNTWADGNLPKKGDNIVISSGNVVTYDLNYSPIFSDITVKGKLDFTRTKSTSITFGNMTIERIGNVEIGTNDSPIPSNTKTIIQLDASKEGNAGINVLGSLQIHGTPIKDTFTKLSRPAENDTKILAVTNNVSWRIGDHIVVTSTSLDSNETEENTIASISGNIITLEQPLAYPHDGTAPAQGEVADLTRNVIVTSLNPDVHAMGVMFMQGSSGGISYAEFSHLGGESILGSYPIHFHHVQNTMQKTLIDGISVWDSHNRFLTIHNSDNITVRNSVGYKSIGHGFFLEDGTEENNTLANNIAILTMPGSIRPDDGGASGFWVQNPQNYVYDNIAVSASGSGFDFSIPENAPDVIPLDKENLKESLPQGTTPTVLNIGMFRGNEAHSNSGDGFHLYRLDQGNSTEFNTFSAMKMWRNGGNGIEITASPSIILDSTIFGNQQGNIQVDTSNMTINNVKVMGELPDVTAKTYTINGNTSRYVIAPFGMVFSATNMTIKNSLFQGHMTDGIMGSADIINRSNGLDALSMEIYDTQLLSKHKIIFGYPLNGDSHMRVTNHGQGFTLYRYDRVHQDSCVTDPAYMAIKCTLTDPEKQSN